MRDFNVEDAVKIATVKLVELELFTTTSTREAKDALDARGQKIRTKFLRDLAFDSDVTGRWSTPTLK